MREEYPAKKEPEQVRMIYCQISERLDRYRSILQVISASMSLNIRQILTFHKESVLITTDLNALRIIKRTSRIQSLDKSVTPHFTLFRSPNILEFLGKDRLEKS